MKATRADDSNYDVVVVGGGPAGAAAATFIQQYGHRCLVLERSHFPRYHIGESLIPHTYGTLERLGLLPALKASHFPVKQSVRFVSPSGEETEPFYFSESVDGERARTWQVERSEFDTMCLDNARDNGVEVRMNATTKRVVFDGERAVGVLCTTEDGEHHAIRSRVVVDASGRSTLISSQLGLKEPVPGLHKSSLWSYYKGGKRAEGINSGETIVFQLPDGGWFWYIPLPDDIVSVGIVASPEQLFGKTAELDAAFLHEVEGCPPLMRRLEDAVKTGRVCGIPELAYRSSRPAGDGWVLVGDAMCFLDPVYSSGVFLALASAELAADCVHKALTTGDVSAAKLGEFVPTLSRGVDVIHSLIHAFYDPNFSFREFVDRFPEQRRNLIDCLMGDVVDKDMSGFAEALEQMTSVRL